MKKTDLKKSNGDVFFEATRREDNAFILVNWIGIQSLETIMMGANLLLNMVREQACPVILNSNKELIGPWDDGAFYLGSSWAPRMKMLGLKHFAHVLAPGIYGIRSFETFHQFAQIHFQIEVFETDTDAITWILS